MAGYYDDIVAISKDYLGPAAERFVNRQMEFHLEKKPGAELTKEDIHKIAHSVQTALGLLSSEKMSALEAGKRIEALIK